MGRAAWNKLQPPSGACVKALVAVDRLSVCHVPDPKSRLEGSVIFVNENENENYQKRKNNDSVNEN